MLEKKPLPGDSKCPFHPLVGGHLTPWKGHVFTIPKRSRIESPGEESPRKNITIPSSQLQKQSKLRETNSSHLPGGPEPQKDGLVFQPAHFQVLPVSFREGTFLTLFFRDLHWVSYLIIPFMYGIYLLYIYHHFTIKRSTDQPTNTHPKGWFFHRIRTQGSVHSLKLWTGAMAASEFYQWKNHGRNSRHLLMATRNPGSGHQLIW